MSTSSSLGVRLPPSQVDCKWWAGGYCARGKKCHFRHDEALAGSQSREPEDATGDGAREKGKGKVRVALPSGYTPGTSSDAPASWSSIISQPSPAASEQELCSICFEKPDMYGLLVNCDHVFCLECIRNWRASTTAGTKQPSEDELRKTSKTCPICRSHSHFIVPSSFFPDCGTTNGVRDKENAAKKEIVERYLARLKTLPCRYFEESIKNSAPGFMPKCKFGNRCHYLHSHPVTKQPYVFSAKELERPRKFNGNRRGVLDQIAMIGIILDELSLDFEYDSEDGSDAGYSSNSPVGYIDDNGYFYF